MGEDGGPAKIIPGKGVAWRGALPPGSNQTMVQFALPVEDGRAVLNWPLPFGLARGQLMLVEVPGMDITKLAHEDDVSGQTVNREVREAKNGMKVALLPPIRIAPGQSLLMGIDNLPERSPWDQTLRILVGLGALALLGWGFGSALLRRRPETKGMALRDSENAMDELVRLEARNKKGLVEPDVYASEREQLLQRLEGLRREESAG
jgi:hypothetical protein